MGKNKGAGTCARKPAAAAVGAKRSAAPAVGALTPHQQEETVDREKRERAETSEKEITRGPTGVWNENHSLGSFLRRK